MYVHHCVVGQSWWVVNESNCFMRSRGNVISCARRVFDPDSDAFLNYSRDCYFELKRRAYCSSTGAVVCWRYKINMPNISFPPQIANYILGQPLGSGVSGMFSTWFSVD